MRHHQLIPNLVSWAKTGSSCRRVIVDIHHSGFGFGCDRSMSGGLIAVPSLSVRPTSGTRIAAKVAALSRFHHSRCDRLRVPGSQQEWRPYHGSITLVAATGYDISYERNRRYSVTHKTHTNVSECGEVTIPLLPIACGLRVRARVSVAVSNSNRQIRRTWRSRSLLAGIALSLLASAAVRC